eukprot:14638850-Heterocapsa_arctica.AAC.1
MFTGGTLPLASFLLDWAVVTRAGSFSSTGLALMTSGVSSALPPGRLLEGLVAHSGLLKGLCGA